MKKTLIALVAAVSMTIPAYAGPTQTANVSATIGQVLDLSMSIFKLDNTGTPVGADLSPNMPFGALVSDAANGVMYGADPYAVYLFANTSSRPYTIKATMAPLSNGATNLPPETVMTVVSAKSGGVDIAGDAFTAGGQNAIMTNQVIYTSNAGGTAASIQLVYGISGGNPAGQPAPFVGWQPVLLGQAAGAYSTNVQYTVTLTI